MSLDPENTLWMDLAGGRVVIRLRPDLAPNHVTSGLAGISVPEAAVRLRWLPNEPAGEEGGVEAEVEGIRRGCRGIA